jgi:hypothetical protein
MWPRRSIAPRSPQVSAGWRDGNRAPRRPALQRAHGFFAIRQSLGAFLGTTPESGALRSECVARAFPA